MTNLEYGLKKGLVKWEHNDLFGYTTITIKDTYPKNDEDLKKIIKYLNEEDK